MNILLNQYVILVLRLTHIISGVLWVGGGTLFIVLLLPTVRAVGPASGAVMQNFGPRFGKYMGIITTLAVLSGALLYSRFFIGQRISWIWTTGPGIGFTAGAIAGFASYFIGSGVLGPTQGKINQLGAEMSAGQPSAEQATKMQSLQTYIMNAYKLDLVLLGIAVGAMAVARYL
jgi:hypothetical protein